jgi:hypothetical protein
LRKAFPSQDRRHMGDAQRALGIDESKCIKTLMSARDDAHFSFSSFRKLTVPPPDAFQVPHGWKEGCSSSPDFYNTTYEQDMRRTSELRRKLGVLPVKIVSLRYLTRSHAERVAKIVFGSHPEVGKKEVTELERINFADDTSNLEQGIAGGKPIGDDEMWTLQKAFGQKGRNETVEQMWKRAGLSNEIIEHGRAEAIDKQESHESVFNMCTPALAAIRGAYLESGARENLDKFYCGLLGSGTMKGRNLGQQLDRNDDTVVRRTRGYGNFHALRGRIANLRLSRRLNAQAIQAVCRPALSYGLVSRAVHPDEWLVFQKAEDDMTRKIFGINLWMMAKKDGDAPRKNMADYRYDCNMTTFRAQIEFLRMRQFGHWMRHDSQTRRLLCGAVLIEKSGKLLGMPELSNLEYINVAGKSQFCREGCKEYLEQIYEHLIMKCCIPEAVVSALTSSSDPEVKKIYYVLTREAQIRAILSDYQRANVLMADRELGAEKLEKRKVELCKKHGITNLQLDSHRVYFSGGYCVACKSFGGWTDQERLKHWRFWHDLELRGDEYKNAMEGWLGEEAWEKKLKLSSEKRREDEAQREKEFLEANKENVTVIQKWAPRELGRYRCRQCKETLDTSVAGMERHLEAHSNLNVMKLYRNPNTKRFHPGEQYFRPGGFVSCPNSLLHCYVINGKRFERGDKWECTACKTSITWEEEHTGQRGARIVEKIERHIRDYNTHGNCDAPSKEEIRKKVEKLVEKARENSESSEN